MQKEMERTRDKSKYSLVETEPLKATRGMVIQGSSGPRYSREVPLTEGESV